MGQEFHCAVSSVNFSEPGWSCLTSPQTNLTACQCIVFGGGLPRLLRWQFHAVFLSWLPLCVRKQQYRSWLVLPALGWLLHGICGLVHNMGSSSCVSSPRKWEVVCVIILCSQKDDL